MAGTVDFGFAANVSNQLAAINAKLADLTSVVNPHNSNPTTAGSHELGVYAIGQTLDMRNSPLCG